MPNFTPKRRPRYGFTPWAAARHKTRYSLAAQLRAEYGPADDIVDLDVVPQMAAPARRDLSNGRGA